MNGNLNETSIQNALYIITYICDIVMVLMYLGITYLVNVNVSPNTLLNFVSSKAELLQLKPHPFIFMKKFINKKVGNRKN